MLILLIASCVCVYVCFIIIFFMRYFNVYLVKKKKLQNKTKIKTGAGKNNNK